MNEFVSIGVTGFILTTSLIIAIGAQNAFILRQGLLRSHVFVLCLICALCDTVLVAAGILGFGTLVKQAQWLLALVTVGGALFLFFYGSMAFRRTLKPDAMQVETDGSIGLKAAVLTCLALTLLNPHVYLDTVILVGGLSARYQGYERLFFGVGASLGSFLWFFALGYGARLLVPLFQRRVAWVVLDLLIGCVMWGIAARLLYLFLTADTPGTG